MSRVQPDTAPEGQPPTTILSFHPLRIPAPLEFLTSSLGVCLGTSSQQIPPTCAQVTMGPLFTEQEPQAGRCQPSLVNPSHPVKGLARTSLTASQMNQLL